VALSNFQFQGYKTIEATDIYLVTFPPIWHFYTVPRGFWDDQGSNYDDQFINLMYNTLNISTLDEWYRVSRVDLKTCNASTFIKSRGGLMKLLSEVFPYHPWKEEKFNTNQKKGFSMVVVQDTY